MAVLDANSRADFQQIINDAGGHLVVVHFWADWAPQCQQMNDVLTELSNSPQYKGCKFVKVAAESVPEVSMQYEITAVPTCLLVKNKTVLDRVNGANAAELTKKVQLNASVVNIQPTADPKEGLNTRLKKLVNAAPVMLFMKGNPEEPRCGFSRQIVQILKEQNVKFSTFDILSDPEVRQGLKEFSNWPTFPQLYGSGELMGGLDIVKELVESGELASQLPKQDNLEDRLKDLIQKEKVMLFMKGNPSEPRCGFSRATTAILQESGVAYGHFDILSDEDVRQGLKKYSNWPTYPQLYVNGELIGGLDILKELKECGELESTLKSDQ